MFPTRPHANVAYAIPSLPCGLQLSDSIPASCVLMPGDVTTLFLPSFLQSTGVFSGKPVVCGWIALASLNGVVGTCVLYRGLN
jgi:hypothetical protein